MRRIVDSLKTHISITAIHTKLHWYQQKATISFVLQTFVCIALIIGIIVVIAEGIKENSHHGPYIALCLVEPEDIIYRDLPGEVILIKSIKLP